MNTSAIITSACIVVCILVPMFLYTAAQKRKKQQRVLKFLELGRSHELNLSEYDFTYNIAIGLDKESNNLLFVHEHQQENKTQIISINNIKKCEISNISRSNGSGKNLVTIIDRAELVLKPKENTAKDQRLEFFNSDYDSHITTENELLDKWSLLINQQIK